MIKYFPNSFLYNEIARVLFLLQICDEGHKVDRWCSQPRLTNRGVHAGDYMLACNILLSGNNFRKIMLLFQFMNLGTITPVFFNRVQMGYVCPIIDTFYNKQIQDIIELCQGKPLVLAG